MRWFLAALLALLAGQADAQQSVLNYWDNAGTWVPVSGTNPLPVTSGGGSAPVNVTPAPTTYQGTMTLGSASSTSLIAANVTMNNSTVLPAAGSFAKLTIINVGTTNGAFICWFGGTCSATAGGELLAAGASDTVNLTGAANAPTMFSTSGTNLSFRN
jgi:hypothetical protein